MALLPAKKRLGVYRRAVKADPIASKRVPKGKFSNARARSAEHLRALRKQAQKETGKTGRALYRG